MLNRVVADKYRITAELGRGGMGVVYRATHTVLGREDALKVLHHDRLNDPEFTHRFFREARAMARLDHEHIIRVFDIFEDQGTYYLAMEFFPGQSLKDMLRRQGPLTVRQAVEVITQAADGLAYAHENGIVHRDIKPGNIMVDQDLNVKIADFGIAAAKDETGLTLTGQLVGSPRYMAPEQARGEQADHRSDLFSLGMVFYELLTGKNVFEGESGVAIIGKLAYQQDEFALEFPAAVPQALRAIVIELVRRQPAERIQNARSLLERLRWFHETTYKIRARRRRPAPDPERTELDNTAGTNEETSTGNEQPAAAPPPTQPDSSGHRGPPSSQSHHNHHHTTAPARASHHLRYITAAIAVLGLTVAGYLYLVAPAPPAPSPPLPVAAIGDDAGSPAAPTTTTPPTPPEPAQIAGVIAGIKTIETLRSRVIEEKQRAGTAQARMNAQAVFAEALAAERDADDLLAQVDAAIRASAFNRAEQLLKDAERRYNDAQQHFVEARRKALQKRALTELAAAADAVEKAQRNTLKAADEALQAGAEQLAPAALRRARAAQSEAAEQRRRADSERGNHRLEPARTAYSAALSRFNEAEMLFAKAREAALSRQRARDETRQQQRAEVIALQKEIQQLEETLNPAETTAAAQQARRWAPQEIAQAVRSRQLGRTELTRSTQYLEEQNFDAARRAALAAKEHFTTASAAFATALRITQEKAAAAQAAEAAEQAARNREQEIRRIGQLLHQFELAYEAKDLKSLTELTQMSAERRHFLEQIFQQYDTVEVSISSFSVTDRNASATVTIDKLISIQGDRVIPGNNWKSARLHIEKDGDRWQKIAW